jgi:lysophospholipase L1-like esterase
MTHIVLLGDSIFDNAPYVDVGEDVIHYLKHKTPSGWKATLLAIDGSVTTDIHDQVQKLPEDSTHLFLSIGGNDALRNINYLSQEAQSVSEVITGFSRLVRDFRANYVNAIKELLKEQLPITVCTIYEPSFEQADQQTIAATALTFWNDVIIQTAVADKLPIIELRQIFTSTSDYANPIEPSATGADKLSDYILEIVQNHNFTQPQTIMYGSSKNPQQK